MATYMIDQGSKRCNYGYGTAVAVILFVISLRRWPLLYQVFVLRRDIDGARRAEEGPMS